MPDVSGRIINFPFDQRRLHNQSVEPRDRSGLGWPWRTPIGRILCGVLTLGRHRRHPVRFHAAAACSYWGCPRCGAPIHTQRT